MHEIDARPCTTCSTTGIPTVVHDLHESVPLLMTWNGTGPYNPNIDPITFSEFQELSFHEVQAMTALGMPGVSTWNFGEAFSHLYLDSVAMNHNAIGRGYETFGNGTAETLEQTLQPGGNLARVVSRGAAAIDAVPLVGARQRQLQRDGGARRARPGRDAVEDAAAQFLSQGLQLLAQGRR